MSVANYFTGTYGTMYYVRDMARSVKLYKEAFGFQVLSESPYWSEIAQPGGQVLCLHLADSSMKSLPGGILIQNVVKMSELIEKLKAKGVEFTAPPHEVHAGEYTTHYRDLDGNEVSLYGKLS
jgi:predicted enzyme related to lactoylglutathione lyase